MFNGNNIEVKPTIENENNITTTNYFNINVNFLKNLNVKINMANLKDMMHEDDDTVPAPVTESEIKFNNQVFDVNSDHWNQIFEEDPTPEKLFETYLDSFENFLGTGLLQMSETESMSSWNSNTNPATLLESQRLA